MKKRSNISGLSEKLGITEELEELPEIDMSEIDDIFNNNHLPCSVITNYAMSNMVNKKVMKESLIILEHIKETLKLNPSPMLLDAFSKLTSSIQGSSDQILKNVKYMTDAYKATMDKEKQNKLNLNIKNAVVVGDLNDVMLGNNMTNILKPKNYEGEDVE